MTAFDDDGSEDRIEDVDTLLQQAELARRSGDPAAALDALGQVLEVAPDHPGALLLAAEINRRAGRPRIALQLCLDLLEACPGDIDTRLEMARALSLMGCDDEAHAIHDLLLHERPEAPLSWSSLGTLLAAEGRPAAALACHRRALTLDPAHAPALSGLARLLADSDERERALDLFHDAIAIAPDSPEPHAGLAATLVSLGRTAEAADHLDRALALDPVDPEALLLRAQMLERLGLRRDAWAVSARIRLLSPPRPTLLQERWEGGPVEGLRLVVIAEGPPALTLRLCRFIPSLAERGGRAILMAPPDLLPLLDGLDGVDRVVRDDALPPDDPPAHLYVTLPDLPRLLDVDPPPPAWAPPLDPVRRRPVVVPPGIRLKVGLAWGRDRPADPIATEDWLSLAAVPGIALFGLDPDMPTRDIADPALITDLTPTIGDAADLAARIAEMDLVIARPSLCAELAASLGVPVWLVLPALADPCWGSDRDTTPWYPTLRLYRPSSYRDNERTVMAKLRADLERHSTDRARAQADELHLAARDLSGQAAFLAVHLGPADLLIDVEAGDGAFALAAAARSGAGVLALCPCPGEARALREAALAAGLDDRVEVIAAAAGSRQGTVMVSRVARRGRRVFPVPDWVSAQVPCHPLADLLDRRARPPSTRWVIRLGQTGDEAEILDGLGPHLASGAITAVILDHQPNSRATEHLNAAGFSVWTFPGEVAAGPVIPFNDQPGPVLALAPDQKPAAHYGPRHLPATPTEIASARDRAAVLAATALDHQSAGRIAEAATCHARALMTDPFCPAANADKGVLLHLAGRRAAAAACFRRALARGDNPTIAANLAACLLDLGHPDEALAALAPAIATTPDDPLTLYTTGLIYRDQGRLSDAAGALRQAATARPAAGFIAQALAETLLAAGQLEEGLALFGHARPPPPGPTWDGSPLEGRSLLITTGSDPLETMMLARYVPLAAARGGLVTLMSDTPDVVPLLDGLAGVEAIATGSPGADTDLSARLVDLPRLLGEKGRALRPPGLPYLTAPPARSRRSGRDERLRVGLAWGGRPAGRGCPLGPLLALAADPDLALIALAGDDDIDEEISAQGARALLERPVPVPTDPLEMAEIIGGLDLVIGGDRLETHLAAAMGRPVWLILPDRPNWRWPSERGDSPWYPSARVFRPDGGDWHRPIARIAQALKAITAVHRRDVMTRWWK